ncbi:MAG: protocatechuate 4,5-dioxygenase subunit alpha [Gammaproteobacteria bacterium]|nr:protocatechuate 4,5-dioxygenase subunit alpha [Gammaproteobacteria bacterium]
MITPSFFGNGSRIIPRRGSSGPLRRGEDAAVNTSRPKIPGTTPFDGVQARKGYALNKMCYSFNSAENRAAFLEDEEAYMRKFGLNAEQAAAIRARNVLALIAAGGNAYYLAKFAGIFGLDMQDIGAQQTGLTKAEFQAKLRAAANG